jgi:hypothetical protein
MTGSAYPEGIALFWVSAVIGTEVRTAYGHSLDFDEDLALSRFGFLHIHEFEGLIAH